MGCLGGLVCRHGADASRAAGLPDALLPAGISVGWFDATRYARNLAVAPAPIPGSYAALRDMLRAHRVQLRIARVLMGDSGQMTEFLRRVELATGTETFWLGSAPYMNELDSAPDPEVALQEEVRALRTEAADQRAFIAATRALVAQTPGGGVVAIVKRARATAKVKAKAK